MAANAALGSSVPDVETALEQQRPDVATDLPQRFTVGREIGRLDQSIVRYNLKDDPAAAAAASNGPCAWPSVFEALPGRHRCCCLFNLKHYHLTSGRSRTASPAKVRRADWSGATLRSLHQAAKEMGRIQILATPKPAL
jgi:hypothetical protein